MEVQEEDRSRKRSGQGGMAGWTRSVDALRVHSMAMAVSSKVGGGGQPHRALKWWVVGVQTVVCVTDSPMVGYTEMKGWVFDGKN
eukprot:752288-Hanusia_phi.AAC.8